MRAVICGAGGAMGQLLQKSFADSVVGLVSLEGENGAVTSFSQLSELRADVVVDFSHHSAIFDVLDYAVAHNCAAVIGTTGHTIEEKQKIAETAKKIPVFYSGNMSLGIAVLCRLAKQAVQSFPDADIEIVEVHHNRKADAPSGTAHMIFESLKEVRQEAYEHCGRDGEGKRQREEIGISSVRMGGVVGIHEVHIATNSQILTLRHEARDRAMFADGALEAARFLMGKAPGLYTMNDLLEA